MSIPLKYRKVIKEAVAGLEERLKEASAISGVTLTFEDNTSEIYAAMAAVDESEPDKLKYLPDYGTLMVDAFKTVATDDIGKEGLASLLNSAGGKVKFIIHPPSATLENYWVVDSTGFGIEIRSDSLGAWPGYYSADLIGKLASVQTEGAQMSLMQRKNLAEVEGDIAAAMKKVSEAFGSELTWDPDYGKLWNWLVENADPYSVSDGWNNLGTAVSNYVTFFSDTLTEFLGNPDNKEAVQDKLTTKKLGFAYLPKSVDKDVEWAWVDGKLCLEVKAGAFGYWITTSYYSLDKLEATL